MVGEVVVIDRVRCWQACTSRAYGDFLGCIGEKADAANSHGITSCRCGERQSRAARAYGGSSSRVSQGRKPILDTG